LKRRAAGSSRLRLSAGQGAAVGGRRAGTSRILSPSLPRPLRSTLIRPRPWWHPDCESPRARTDPPRYAARRRCSSTTLPSTCGRPIRAAG